MNQSNAYRLSQQIELTRQAIARATAKIRYVELALKFGFVTTWLLYFIFAMGFYVADLWGLTTWITANTSELAAFVVFLCMAILMAQTLSMIKHVFYEHKAEFRYGLGIVLLIGLLGVFFELFNSSSQQQHMAFSHAEKSKTFESVANTVVNVSGAGDNSYQLAKLEGELAKAREYLAVCKKTCREYQAKVASLEAQANSLKDSSAHASATAGAVANSTIKAKAETMQALREDSHKPVFKFVRDSFGVSISTAVVLVAGIVAAGFEFSHALLSRILGEKLGMLSGLQQQLISMESAYIDATGKPYSGQATPTPADEPQHPEPEAVAEPKRQPFGFNLPPAQPATASKASPVLFKYQQQPEVKAERATFPMGFPIPAAPRPAPRKSPNPESVAVDVEYQLECSTGDGRKYSKTFKRKQDADNAFRTLATATDLDNSPIAHVGLTERLADNIPCLGTEEVQLPIPEFADFKARGGGWAAPALAEPTSPAPPSSTHPNPHPNAVPAIPDTHPGQPSASHLLADPGNFAVLARIVRHQKFDVTVLDVATGKIGCSQSAMKKAHSIGGDTTQWIMIILEAFEVVTEPNTNNQGKRELVSVLTDDQAQLVLTEIKQSILGDNP